MTTNNGTPTVSPIARIEALYDRLTHARALVADNKVHPIYGMADHYFVEGKDAKYLVNSNCVCPDAINRPELAALIVSEQTANAETPQAETASPETERTLEDKLADLYPKAGPADSLR
jgi:hypothetical protein